MTRSGAVWEAFALIIQVQFNKKAFGGGLNFKTAVSAFILFNDQLFSKFGRCQCPLVVAPSGWFEEITDSIIK